MKTLDLDDSPFSRVWLETVAILQADPTLDRVVKTWIVPDGEIDPTEMSTAYPLIRLDPAMAPMAVWSEDSHAGDLIINVRLGIRSYDATDRLNLWAALMYALYPRNDRNRQLQIQQKLKDAGADDTGQFEFSMPPAQPDPRADAEGIQLCDAQMRIGVVWRINP